MLRYINNHIKLILALPLLLIFAVAVSMSAPLVEARESAPHILGSCETVEDTEVLRGGITPSTCVPQTHCHQRIHCWIDIGIQFCVKHKICHSHNCN